MEFIVIIVRIALTGVLRGYYSIFKMNYIRTLKYGLLVVGPLELYGNKQKIR